MKKPIRFYKSMTHKIPKRIISKSSQWEVNFFNFCADNDYSIDYAKALIDSYKRFKIEYPSAYITGTKVCWNGKLYHYSPTAQRLTISLKNPDEVAEYLQKNPIFHS